MSEGKDCCFQDTMKAWSGFPEPRIANLIQLARSRVKLPCTPIHHTHTCDPTFFLDDSS